MSIIAAGGFVESKVGPILMGVAYLALVVFIIIFCAVQSADFDEYSKYWGLFATLVGVATGAIPSFFFKSQADRESTKAQLLAGAADPDKVEAIRKDNPRLFK